TVHDQVLVAVQDLGVIDGGVVAAKPVAGGGQHDGPGGERYEPLFINIFEFLRVGCLRTAAEPQRVKDRVLFGVGVLDGAKFPIADFVGIHGASGSQVRVKLC